MAAQSCTSIGYFMAHVAAADSGHQSRPLSWPGLSRRLPRSLQGPGDLSWANTSRCEQPVKQGVLWLPCSLHVHHGRAVKGQSSEQSHPLWQGTLIKPSFHESLAGDPPDCAQILPTKAA